MQDKRDHRKRKLEAARSAAKTTLELIEAELEDLNTGAADDPLRDADWTLAHHGVGRDGLKAAAERGEIALSRGPRGKLLVRQSELRRYLESKPYQRTPRKVEPTENALDAWEAEQEAELQRMGGRQ